MHMRWESLLFAHWRIDLSALRPLVPSALEIDLFEGDAWIGVIPFTMNHIRGRFMPRIPKLHAFHELNVRTYVHCDGVPGVWFFSLDAASRVAVRAARLTFGLNYLDARMSLTEDGGTISYTSDRTHRGAPSAHLDCAWTPGRDLPETEVGSLEFFLTERYCLYSERRGRILRGRVHHEPWRLRIATIDRWSSTMIESLGVESPDCEPHLLHADSLDVDAWLALGV